MNKKKLSITTLVAVILIACLIFATKSIDSKVESAQAQTHGSHEAIIPLDDTSLINEINNQKLVIFNSELNQRRIAAEEDKKHHEEIEAKRIAKQKAKEEEKKKYVAVSRGNESSSNDWIVFNATHYSAYCTGCTGITAFGYDVRNTIYEQGYRVIAVDPSIIKLGSLVEVQTSYGTFKALAGDTGGAIKGHKIDILVENDMVANRLGVEKVQVRVVK